MLSLLQHPAVNLATFAVILVVMVGLVSYINDTGMKNVSIRTLRVGAVSGVLVLLSAGVLHMVFRPWSASGVVGPILVLASVALLVWIPFARRE